MAFVQSVVYLNEALEQILTSLFQATGPVYAKCHLAVAPFTPNPNTDPSTLVEPTFGGYSAKDMQIFTTPAMDGGKSVAWLESILNFVPSDSTVSPPVVGYFFKDAGGQYIGGELFPAPVTMTNPTDQLTLAVQWALSQSAISAQVLVP